MKRLVLRAINKKGITLIELIISIMVLSIIIIAVTTVFAPIYRTYEQANDLAEVNTLLDNVSSVILDDVAKAISISPGTSRFTITASYDIVYSHDEGGLLTRSALGVEKPVFDKEFYRNSDISASCAVDSGLVTISLTLVSGNGWTVSRDYAARPVGLQ